MMCEKYFEVLLNLCEQNSTNTNLNIEALAHGLISKLNTRKLIFATPSFPTLLISRALCAVWIIESERHIHPIKTFKTR
jgi:hypothetical protein